VDIKIYTEEENEMIDFLNKIIRYGNKHADEWMLYLSMISFAALFMFLIYALLFLRGISK